MIPTFPAGFLGCGSPAQGIIRVIFFLVLLCVCSCSKRKAHQEASQAESPLSTARVALSKGKPDQALKILNQLLLNQPDFPEALLERSHCQVALKNPHAALTDLDKLNSLLPKYTEGLLERGMVLDSLNEKSRSRADLKQAMAQDVPLDIYLNWRGLDNGLEARLRADSAPWLLEFTKLAEAEPNNPTIYLLRGLCHLVEGEAKLSRQAFQLSETDFSRSISILIANPGLPQPYDPWANRAFVRGFLGKIAESEADLLMAFKHLPDPELGRELAERVNQARSRAKELQ